MIESVRLLLERPERHLNDPERAVEGPIHIDEEESGAEETQGRKTARGGWLREKRRE